MHIKTFAAEIADSSDLEISVMYEALTAARIASAHMVQTWKMLADMVDATSAELIKRGLKLPDSEIAGKFFDQSYTRAINARVNKEHRLETA